MKGLPAIFRWNISRRSWPACTELPPAAGIVHFLRRDPVPKFPEYEYRPVTYELHEYSRNLSRPVANKARSSRSLHTLPIGSLESFITIVYRDHVTTFFLRPTRILLTLCYHRPSGRRKFAMEGCFLSFEQHFSNFSCEILLQHRTLSGLISQSFRCCCRVYAFMICVIIIVVASQFREKRQKVWS